MSEYKAVRAYFLGLLGATVLVLLLLLPYAASNMRRNACNVARLEALRIYDQLTARSTRSFVDVQIQEGARAALLKHNESAGPVSEVAVVRLYAAVFGTPAYVVLLAKRKSGEFEETLTFLDGKCVEFMAQPVSKNPRGASKFNSRPWSDPTI